MEMNYKKECSNLKGATTKNEEYRKSVFKIFGYKDDIGKRTFIANYHWDLNILLY